MFRDQNLIFIDFYRKVLTELVVCRPLSALTYVRYVLAFKLWKNVVADANEKKNINKIALQRLHPPPKFFQVCTKLNIQICG